MNLIILKRFRNELIILGATLFTILTFSYKHSIDTTIEQKRENIKNSINEINRVLELKKIWKSKYISKKVNLLKIIVAKSKIGSFKKRGQKVIVKYRGVNIKELNSIIKTVMNNPFQIVKLDIKDIGKERYNMELICRW